MIVKSNGIILNTIKYGESSIICKIFTEENGLLSFIISGVRSKKGKEKAGVFQPLNIVEIVYELHENKNLLYIKEFRSAVNYQRLPFQFERSSFGIFVLEILNKTIRLEREHHKEKFAFILDTLKFLDSSIKISANFHLAFMIKYIYYMGFDMEINCEEPYLDLQSGIASAKLPIHNNYINNQELKLFYQLKELENGNLDEVILNRESRIILFKHLEFYYLFHMENFTKMKSPEILSELYA